MTHFNVQVRIQEITEAEYDNYGKLKSDSKIVDRVETRYVADTVDVAIHKAISALGIELNS